MKLIFMRHAEAQPKHDSDTELDDYRRELVHEGMIHAKEMVLTCAFLWKNTKTIFTSSYPRAIQTAQILHRQFPKADFQMHTGLDKFAMPSEIIRFIHTLPNGSYTFVGHEPHLTDTIAKLVTGKSTPLVHLPKGGLVMLEGPGVSELKIRTVLSPRMVMRF